MVDINTERRTLRRPQPLLLDPVRDVSFDARTVGENFDRIQQFFDQVRGVRESVGFEVRLRFLAALLGGQYCSGPAVTAQDLDYDHDLGRLPELILFAWHLDGTGQGRLYGVPSGGFGGSGSNETPWTSSTIYVRSSVDGTYGFIVI